MATLLLKLDAPMQSWGTSMKIKDHNTDLYPSKSGVLGTVASALGLDRDDDAGLQELAKLRFGVKIVRAGELMKDFHTSWIQGEKHPKVSNRYYLADAEFLCGIEGELAELERIEEAIRHPANALFLGRRSCPVTVEFLQDIVEEDLETALSAGEDDHCRILVESDDPTDQIVRDQPLSFSTEHRQYAVRFIKELNAEHE